MTNGISPGFKFSLMPLFAAKMKRRNPLIG
jgi:hypothetical protein